VVAGSSRSSTRRPAILFVREATLVAQRFDAGSGELTGDPIPVAEVSAPTPVGLADFSVSRTGSLAYRRPRRPGALRLVDRKGSPTPWRRDRELGAAALSPDGRWLVYQVGSATDGDLWCAI
jgi:hypothetical protein